MGVGISGITLISCVFYLFYEWKREKGDKLGENLRKD